MIATIAVPAGIPLTLISDFIHGTERTLVFVYRDSGTRVTIYAEHVSFSTDEMIDLETLRFLTALAATV